MAYILQTASSFLGPIFNFIVFALLWMAPAYFANMAPVVANKFNWFPGWSSPVSHRWFGANKTWRGLAAGYLFALAAVVILYVMDISPLAPDMYIDYASIPVLLLPLTALQFAVGALGGDMVKSCVKRHWARIPPGKPWNPWDRIDFILGTLVMMTPLFIEWSAFPPRFTLLGQSAVFVIVATFYMQRIVNTVAYNMGWKKDI